MKLEELLTLYQKEKPQLSPRTIQKYKSIITMFANILLYWFSTFELIEKH
jgi:hypothetical protein